VTVESNGQWSKDSIVNVVTESEVGDMNAYLSVGVEGGVVVLHELHADCCGISHLGEW